VGEKSVAVQMLTALNLGTEEWVAIAMNASWQMTRMNLNTFARHGVFERNGMAEVIAARLRDARSIAKARAFPYQLMAAYATVDSRVPQSVRDALQDAMEIAISNVPAIEGRSRLPRRVGSMQVAVTGYRRARRLRSVIDVAPFGQQRFTQEPVRRGAAV
jgi:60 kDa SS-A/Ro ribonucleoprotein